MSEPGRAGEVDAAFRLARSGSQDGFAQWMGMVEMPIRRTLARFARSVDVESVMQETLLRMWILANDPDRVLKTENASLKFACGVARNVAREEIRRYRMEEPLDDAPDVVVEPPLPDPFLRKAIDGCVAQLPGKPRGALLARLREGYRGDREAAAAAGMKVNTFLQNVVRARNLLRPCLERKGVRLAEILTMKKGRPEILIEQACSAFRERDRSGRILPSTAWLDLAPEGREEVFRLQLESREIERGLSPDGSSGTVHAVLDRLSGLFEIL